MIKEIELKDKIHAWVRENVKNGDSFLRNKLREQEREIEEQQRRMDHTSTAGADQQQQEQDNFYD